MSSYVAALVTLIGEESQPSGLGGLLVAGVSVPPVPKWATFPWITVQQLPSREVESMTGTSGLAATMMQVNCWDKDYEQAWDLREAVKELLLSYTGEIGDSYIQAVNHGIDAELYDSQRELHQLIVRFRVWWEH